MAEAVNLSRAGPGHQNLARAGPTGPTGKSCVAHSERFESAKPTGRGVSNREPGKNVHVYLVKGRLGDFTPGTFHLPYD